jgi:hypothetical protein
MPHPCLSIILTLFSIRSATYPPFGLLKRPLPGGGLAPVGKGSFGGDSEERPRRHLPGLRKNNGRRRAEIDQTDEVNGRGRSTAADNSDGGLPATSIEGSHEDEE